MLLSATSTVVNLKVGSLLGAVVWVNEPRSSESCGRGEKKSPLDDGELMKCVATLSLVHLALLIIPGWLSSCVKSRVITSPHSRAGSTPHSKYLCCRRSTNPALLWEERNGISWVGTGDGQKIQRRIKLLETSYEFSLSRAQGTSYQYLLRRLFLFNAFLLCCCQHKSLMNKSITLCCFVACLFVFFNYQLFSVFV